MKTFKEFKEHLAADSAFFEKYSKLTDTADIIAAAKEDGYEVTEDNLLEFTEFSDEELSGVAGGTFTTGVSGEYTPYRGIIG